MTATDELRRMLDERGMKYTKTIVTEGVLFTVTTEDEHYFVLVRDNGAGIEMWSQYLTPEQAIAATLGAGTCKLTLYEDTGITVCSECGAVQPDDWTVYYCWSCGRRIVEVTDG